LVLTQAPDKEQDQALCRRVCLLTAIGEWRQEQGKPLHVTRTIAELSL